MSLAEEVIILRQKVKAQAKEIKELTEINKMRPSTFESYSGNLRVHIKPHIGDIKLAKLRTSDLQKFYSKLLTEGRVVRKESEKKPKGLSPKTVRNVHIFISTALGPKNAAAGGR